MDRLDAADRSGHRRPAQDQGARRTAAEVLLIFGLCFLYAGSPPPDVNEAHYLAKAKHFWNPDWCGPDVFLDSADAHSVFYGTFGWPTRLVSLNATAWLGRLVTWGLLAFGWQRLSWSILPLRYASVGTAALFVTLSNQFHLAGEWAVGGLEAKGPAYVLVLFALEAYVRCRWNRVWIWLGGATALHVLVGGWSLVAAAVCWLCSGSSRLGLRSMWSGLLAGAMLSLLGLLPALLLMFDADPTTARQANEIYVYGRLAHHLVFDRMALERKVMFALLLLTWMVLGWFLREANWRRLNRFAAVTLGFSLVGVVIDMGGTAASVSVAGLLKFYWFRLADVLIPLSVALGLPVAAEQLALVRPRAGRFVWGAIIIGGCIFFGLRYGHMQWDFRPRAMAQSQPCRSGEREQLARRFLAWQEVCRWVALETDPKSRFLTPRSQQTFTWYAGRAEVACWKDIPQDAASIVRWWQLLQEIYPPAVMTGGLGSWSDEQLQGIAERHDVDYILVDRRMTRRSLGLQRVYPDPSVSDAEFELYRVYRHGSVD